MGYYDVALLTRDTDFLLRVAAAYAQETPVGMGGSNPDAWATDHAWDMAAAPGFGDAYASAVVSGNPNPGRDPAVITDQMILSQIQTVLGSEGGS